MTEIADADLAMAVIDAAGRPGTCRPRHRAAAWQAAPATSWSSDRPARGRPASRPGSLTRNATPDGTWSTCGPGDLTGTTGRSANSLTSANLSQVLAGGWGPAPARWLSTGLDATRHVRAVTAPLAILASSPGPLAAVVDRAGVRPEVLAGMEEALPRSAGGRSAIRRAPGLVRHLMVDRLTEPRSGSSRRPAGACSLFDPVRPRLAELVRNPFNLNLAAAALRHPARVQPCGASWTCSTLYWDQRVATGPRRLRAAATWKSSPGR